MDPTSWTSPQQVLAAFREHSADPYPDRIEPDRIEPDSLGTDHLAQQDSHQDAVTWLYHPADYPAALLHAIVMRGRAAATNVDYADTYRRPSPVLHLRCHADHLRLLAHGDLEPAEGTTATLGQDGWWELRGHGVLGARLTAPLAADGTSEGAAVGLDGRAVQAEARGIELSTDATNWLAPRCEHGALLPVHLAQEPTVLLHPTQRADGVWDLGTQALGWPVIELAGVGTVQPGSDTGAAVTLGVGESVAESGCDPEVAENRTDLVPRAGGGWTTAQAVAGRYLRLGGEAVGQARLIGFEAMIHPVARRGAFLSSDPVLNEIWDRAALTLRLCTQRLVIDGIKRDRMPWAGDQALNTLANAYALGEGQVVLDGLRALGSPSDGLVNGTLTYSLWWMVNAAEARRYLGLDDALDELAQGAEDLLERLSARIDPASGALRGDTSEEPTWVFVDWGYEVARDALATSLQLLWYWALRCVIALQHEAGGRHLSRAEHWQEVSERVASTLRERGWDAQAGAWADYLDLPGDGQGGTPTASPQLLALLSGITPAAGPRQAQGSVQGGQADGVGGVEGSAAAGTVAARLDPSQTHTPFMRGMALRALHTQGLDAQVVAHLRQAWGTMLHEETTTFWEEFPGAGPTQWSMYGRPFGKSLCHAWSSGPATLLPQAVLGLEPTAAGWCEVRIAPSLGDLRWAAAVVPTPVGDLAVVAAGGQVRAWLPEGVELSADSVAGIEVLRS